MSLHILVLEDEPKVLRFIQKALEQSDMTVEAISRIEDLEPYLARTPFDVAILDRLIGGRDSLPLIRKIRQLCPRTRILVLSALGSVDDRVSGLEFGADDYLAKPFHVAELVARIRTLTRRFTEEGHAGDSIGYEDISLKLDTQQALRGEKTIELTSKEFKILALFLRNPQKIFSRAELLDRVWGLNADPGSNVVEVTINRLRAKIDMPNTAPLVHTKRGSGYWFGHSSSEP